MQMWKAFVEGFASRIGREPHRRDAKDPLVARGEDGGEGLPPGVIDEPPMEIDGRCMNIDEFVAYVEGLEFAQPLPTRVFLHHTWRPTPETWHGRSTIYGMKAYYEQQLWEDSQGRTHKGWTKGPHLFVAEDGIWLFSDLAEDGVGVYGHNYRTRHIEVVGNYDEQLPTGAILENTIAVIGILHEKLGLDVQKLAFHRDFSSKSCPGWAVTKEWIIPQAAAWIAGYRRRKDTDLSALRVALRKLIQDVLVDINPQTALSVEAEKRGLLGALTGEVPMEIGDQGYVVQLFADALLVPVGKWDQVTSLVEWEAAQAKARKRVYPNARSPQRELGFEERGLDDGEPKASPEDDFNFDGRIR